MQRPGEQLIRLIAPPFEIDELPISDATSIRNVAHAEQLNTMRLPRGGEHNATLVVAKKYYDGASGGEAGHYALAYIEFAAYGSRWRTAGVKIRAEEAARIARDMRAHKPSKPGRKEPERVGGKVIATEESELRGATVGVHYVVFVKHKHRGTTWSRTLGVQITPIEKAPVAALLQQLSKEK